jgi:hypothetical protein
MNLKCASLFFFPRKFLQKDKNLFPSLAKESALIPIVKNQIDLQIPQSPQISEYTIDPQSKIEETTLYYYQTLEVGKHHTMDPIMEGILSCSLASSRGHPPIELQAHNTILLFISHYIS